MTRMELEEHVQEVLRSGGDWVYLLMNGDPSASRQRLLGHNWGPKGWVIGHQSPNNIVRFNVDYLEDYLDELEVADLPGDEDIRCEVASPELVSSFTNWR